MDKPPRPSLRQTLLILLCSVHAVTLLVCLLPAHLRDLGWIGGALGHYQNLTGSQQEWVMFHTIPTIHRLEPRFKLTAQDGVTMEKGVVLPGFLPFPEPEHARYYVILHRMIHLPEGPQYAGALLRRAAAQLPPVAAPARLSLEIDAATTRSLKGVRALREIAVNRATVFGPVVVPAK